MTSVIADLQLEVEAPTWTALRVASALALQDSILLREAPAPVSEAFGAARLGEDRSFEDGALGTGLDLGTLIARA